MAVTKAVSRQQTAVAFEVTSGSANVQFMVLYNTTGSVAYLQIFALPSSGVTVGTTTPDYVVPVAASSHLTVPIPNNGWFLGGTGFTIASTTTRGGSTNAAMDVLIGI